LLFRDRMVLSLLAITMLQLVGQFTILPLVAPLLRQLTGATPWAISLAFALSGLLGFVGNLIASHIVERAGTFPTSLAFTAIITAGIGIWSIGAGSYPVMLAGIALWGLGTTGANSMQQARLAASVPKLVGSAVALNTSAIYVGQAIGSAVGGALFVHGHAITIGYIATSVMFVAIVVLLTTRD
jgi:predicted MFS family arabinose efflux permease